MFKYMTKQQYRSFICASNSGTMDKLSIIVLLITITSPISGYRIPKNHEPSSYKIDLDLSTEVFSGDRDTFTGVVEIEVHTINTSNEIKLHSSWEYITLQNVYINNTAIAKESFSVDNITDILTITQSTKEGDKLILKFDYTGKLADDMYGFYKSSYEEDSTTKYLATTQFEATFARRAFPCFDEPEYKAKFTVSITHPSTVNALSNTLGTPEGQTNTKTTFEESPIMSSYLVAFIVSDFNCTSSAADSTSVPHSICSRKGVDLASRKWAVEVGPKLLNNLNSYTSIDYNNYLSKMDQVAIPDFSAGAMENWGLVTYREGSLLWSENESTNRNKQSIAAIIAHEFTHMWFGNIVTTRWWNTIYLNEGFARLFQYLIVAMEYPDWEMEKQFVVEQLQNALSVDIKQSQALEQDASTPTEISSRFGTISYAKGAAILRMVKSFFGDSNFKMGLNYYLIDRNLNYTESNNLWTNLQRASLRLGLPAPLSDIMQNWVEKNGYPLVTVSKVGNNITLSQQKYQESETNSTKWYIPISYVLSNDTSKSDSTEPQVWLTPSENVTFDISDNSWIILNNQVTGYYRVHYDETLLHEIGHALDTDSFSGVPEISRAQIVDDIFNLASIGKIKYSIAFHHMEFLKRDNSYYTWYSAFNGFDILKKRIEPGSKLANSVSSHVKEWMGKVYDSAKDANSTDQVYTHKHVLTTTWACKLEISSCVEKIKNEFSEYVSSGNRPEPNLRSVVYCYGLKHRSNNSDWEYLWNAYQTTDIPTEKTLLLSALACTDNTDLLNRYLQYSINGTSGIRPQDASTVFSAVYSNPKGVDVAFDFLINQYKEIQSSYISLNALEKVISGLAERFTSKTQLTKLETFIGKLTEEYGDFKKAAEDALKTATSNVAWIETVRGDLENYFSIAPDGANTVFVSFNLLLVSVLAIFYLY